MTAPYPTPPVPTTYPAKLNGVTAKLRTELEARGLVLFDPKDPADVERLAAAIAVKYVGKPWDMVFSQEWFRTGAGEVLRALAGDPHG